MILFLMVMAEFAMIAYAGSRPNYQVILGAGVFANMILIALFAPYLVEVGGLVTNVGTVFYAGVVASMCVVIERFGPLVARDAIPKTYIRLLMIFTACAIIERLPVVEGNEAFAAAAKLVAGHQARVVAASFIAFFLSQMVLVIAYPKIRQRFGAALAVAGGTVLCQAVDSPVFFGVAFSDSGFSAMLNLVVTGFLVKIGVAVVLAPAVFIAVAYAPGRSLTLSYE